MTIIVRVYDIDTNELLDRSRYSNIYPAFNVGDFYIMDDVLREDYEDKRYIIRCVTHLKMSESGNSTVMLHVKKFPKGDWTDDIKEKLRRMYGDEQSKPQQEN